MNDKLLVIGIASLDRDVLETKMRERLLPTLSSLVADGDLVTMISTIQPANLGAWASLSTGTPPALHHFEDAIEPSPAGLRPAGYASWAIKPVWERLSDAGISTASLCWPGTYPGAAWPGIHIDQRFCMPSGQGHDDWALNLDVAPADLRPLLREARVHPTDIPIEALAPFVADLVSVPPQLAATLTNAVSRLATLHASADLLLTSEPRCVFIYYDWIEVVAQALGVDVVALPDAAWQLFDQSVAQLLSKTSGSYDALVTSPGAQGPGLALLPGSKIGASHSPIALSLALANTIYQHFGFSDRSLPRAIRPRPGAHKSLPDATTQRCRVDPDERDLARLAKFNFAPSAVEPTTENRRLLRRAEAMLATDPLQALELARAVGPSEPRSLFALGTEALAQVALGNRVALLDIAERIAAISPDHVWHDLILGAFHALAQNAAAARPYLNNVEAHGAADEKARAGAIWLMLDRRTEAARLFRAILVGAPWHLSALIGLLSTDTVRGMEAEALLRRVLVLEPDHQAAQAALDELLVSLGRAREVRKAGE